MASILYLLITSGYLLIFLDYFVSASTRQDIPRISEECLQFEIYRDHSLYGYNNHIVNDVYLDDCRLLCIRQTLFLCASFEYNEDSGTCFLSADDMYTQPRAFGVNPNTDYYQRHCANSSLPDTTTSTATQSIERTTTASAGTDHTTTYSTQRSTTQYRPSTNAANTTTTTTTAAPSTRSTTTAQTSTPATTTETSTHVQDWTTTPDAGPATIFPEFYGVSYLELVRPNHVHRLCEVTIEFSTGTENGLILYMGDGSNDFLSLAMLNGHLEFRYDTGTGVAVLKSREALSLNTTHIVVASRLNRHGKLLVDDQEEVMGESPEGTEILNIAGNVFVGFVPPELYDLMIQQTEALLGMAGCIQSLMIDGMGSRLKYDLEFSTSEDVIQVENIGVCGDVEVEVSACDLHPCYHGTCIPKQPDTYDCLCEAGYTGGKCESLLIIDVLDHVQVNRNYSSMAWINCIGRSTLENSEWTIKWYQNQLEILDSLKDAENNNFVRTEYETDLLGAEKLFVAQLYFPHITEDNKVQLSGNYTCELLTTPEPLMRKTIEIIF